MPQLPQDRLPEKDTAVDPVADDVATLELDLLMAEKDFHRASGNPMLWQVSRQD